MGRPTKEQQAAKLLAAQNEQEDLTLESARLKLDGLMALHVGQLTMGVVHDYLNAVSGQFNLLDTQVALLKTFKYSREVETESPVNNHENKSHEHNQASADYQIIPVSQISEGARQDKRFTKLEEHCQKLEEAISRIAVLTGNGNHLAELGIERWVPGKKHMNKKYA